MIRVRFAPSPTGRLHLGNARTAILNALFAKHYGGIFILRMDDTDAERNQDAYIDAIQEDLMWLGIYWDETFSQSQRKPIYEKYFSQLVQSGRIYPCFETSQELDLSRQEQLAKGLPPVYDRAKGQTITPHDHPYWRFALDQTEISWHDTIQGPMSYHTRHLSDPVVMRQDGSMSYLLSSVMDDVDSQISHILRGADHLTNTAIQIQMIQALQGIPPIWAHFPLMFNDQGEKFSKRSGSLTIDALKQEGYMPLAIIQSLAQLGLSRMITGSFSEMASAFCLQEYSKSNAKFSIEDIDQAQSRLWSSMTYTDLPEFLRHQTSETLWPLIRDNIHHISDISYWSSICKDHAYPLASLNLDFLPETFLENATKTLRSSNALMYNDTTEKWQWNQDPWPIWVNALLNILPDIKKGILCRTLRLLLTGRAHGPKMEYLLPMISPLIAIERIKNTPSISNG